MFPELVSAWELIKSFWGSARLAGNAGRIKSAAGAKKNTRRARKTALRCENELVTRTLAVQSQMQMLAHAARRVEFCRLRAPLLTALGIPTVRR